MGVFFLKNFFFELENYFPFRFFFLGKRGGAFYLFFPWALFWEKKTLAQKRGKKKWQKKPRGGFFLKSLLTRPNGNLENSLGRRVGFKAKGGLPPFQKRDFFSRFLGVKKRKFF